MFRVTDSLARNEKAESCRIKKSDCFRGMSAARTVEGAGRVTWWGFGPARALLSSDVHTVRSRGEFNILLVGSGDPRHILKTISGIPESDVIHVWVIENSTEVVARQLLLIYPSLLSPETISLHKKTEVFLEIFGNCEIRSETDEFLKHASAELSQSITNTPVSCDSHTHPCLDTSLLKFKERDDLVQIFKSWERPPSVPASARQVWDARVRQHLGTRYDSRQGCFDWDLTMKLHQRGCGVINKHQYVKWRESGVAFEMREGIYQTANQSLLSTRVFNHRGNRVAVRGYWGDIVSSPYLAFGIETDDKDLLKKHNNQHVKTAQDISEVNVLALFECLANRGRCPPSKDAPSPSSTCNPPTDDPKTPEETQRNDTSSQTHTKPAEETSHSFALMDIKGVKISFLSPDSLSKLPLKDRYKNLFNTIYCSASMVHQIESSLRHIAAPDAVLVIELATYLLDLSKEQVSGFAERVKEIAEESGFTPKRSQSDDVYSTFTLKQD
ncbi:dynein axonemal assembly factor 3-like isoform X1 [Triplophysa rosa]|uniref:dynein axonemal assembly factor 3-like isoform X1 n=1 Tax=Triplophysa rosa TaxID=992332 RepID=UPI0025461F35|nr:dynein axonemal assembly factor 3-like isoform X1 [Triplophysa rosa]